MPIRSKGVGMPLRADKGFTIPVTLSPALARLGNAPTNLLIHDCINLEEVVGSLVIMFPLLHEALAMKMGLLPRYIAVFCNDVQVSGSLRNHRIERESHVEIVTAVAGG